MSRLLRRSGMRYFRHHPWQFLLTVVGIAMGVAVAVSVALATGSARRAFLAATESLTGTATHQIIAGSEGIPESFYRHLRVDLGVRIAAPVVAGYVGLEGDASRAFFLLGVDAFADSAVRADLRLVDRDGSGLPLTELLTRQGGVLFAGVPEGLPAGPLQIVVSGSLETLDVVGEAEPASAAGLRDLLIGDIATAQEALGMIGRLTRIDLRLTPAQVRETLPILREALPAGSRIVEARARAAATVQMTRAFEINLQAMSMLALLCGLFLIYNTMTFSVVQRREMFGALRALGVTRGEILRLVLEEALLMGAVGTVLGLASGIALAGGLVGLVTQTVNDLYFTVVVGEVSLVSAPLLAGAVLGVLGTVLAALAPALAATRAPARVVLTRSILEEGFRRHAVHFLAGGLASIGMGFVLARWPGGGLAGAFAGLLAIVLGSAMLAPGLVRFASRPLALLLRRVAAIPGHMAARGLAAGLSRSAVAVAALAVAVAVIVGVGVMVSSFRFTLVDWLAYTLQADLYVTPVNARGETSRLGLDPVQLARLQALDSVNRIRAIRDVRLETDSGPVQLLAVDHARADRAAYRLLEGVAEHAWQQFEAGAVLVSEPYSVRHEVGPGDRVLLPTATGDHSFAIAGVYSSYASEQGAVMMRREAYLGWWGDDEVSGLSVYLAPLADADQARAEIGAILAPSLVTIVSNRQLREQSLRVFDRTFLITGVLRLLVAGVAFVGVLGAVMAMQFERSKEHAMLRATGFTPAQLWQTVLWQSGLIGALASVLALPLGAAMAWIMIHVINRRSFGWSLQMVMEPAALGQAVAVALIAALLAGVAPAARVARTAPAVLLRED